MPVTPSFIERTLIGAGVFPGSIVEIVGAASLRAFDTAERLGIFETLRGGALAVEPLAAKTGADPRSLDALCAVLADAGYLRREGGAYANGPQTTRWILSGEGRGLPDLTRYWHGLLFDQWDELETAVRAGMPATHLHDWLDRTSMWPVFNAAMAELASMSADAIARAVRLPEGTRTLVDLGGSHGLNAIAFCRRIPHLQATILDAPQALGPARARIAAQGYGSRVTVRPADVLRDELGGPYDVALAFQLLHYFPAEQAVAFLARVRAALAPGGTLVILEQLAGGARTPVGRAFLHVLALTYRTALGGDLWSWAELSGRLREVGFTNVRRRSVRRAPGNALVIAS